MHVWRPNYSPVVLYYARSLRECSIFTTHLTQNTLEQIYDI